jgi:hypothetical protein
MIFTLLVVFGSLENAEILEGFLNFFYNFLFNCGDPSGHPKAAWRCGLKALSLDMVGPRPPNPWTPPSIDIDKVQSYHRETNVCNHERGQQIITSIKIPEHKN